MSRTAVETFSERILHASLRTIKNKDCENVLHEEMHKNCLFCDHR